MCCEGRISTKTINSGSAARYRNVAQPPLRQHSSSGDSGLRYSRFPHHYSALPLSRSLFRLMTNRIHKCAGDWIYVEQNRREASPAGTRQIYQTAARQTSQGKFWRFRPAQLCATQHGSHAGPEATRRRTDSRMRCNLPADPREQQQPA